MILVTGGTGLVGANLLLELVKKKKKLRAIYRSDEQIQKVKQFFTYKEPGESHLFKQIEWVRSDLNDLFTLELAFDQITHVYHCAAKVSFADFHNEKMFKTNVEGTANIVNLALKHQVKKLVYVSSIAALGADKNKDWVNEEESWDSGKEHTGYARSKYGAELEIWRGAQEGLPVVIVNPGVVLGGFFWDRSSSTLFSKVAKGLRFYPTGMTGVVDVNDVVKCLLLLMGSTLQNERFILVAENLKMKELLTKMATELGNPPPSIALSKGGLTTLYFIEKLISFLGLRKPFLSRAFIESLCGNQKFDGTKISQFGFSYTPLDQTIKSIAKQYHF